jgi:hypothetical protein
MKFVTVRDLVSNQKNTRKLISKEGTVLTNNGKPIALTIPVNEDNFEYMVNETKLISFKSAVEAIQSRSEKLGITEKDVEKAIREVRKGRAKKRKAG